MTGTSYGASGPRGFDCSGLVQYSYRRAHLRLPRTSDAQARAVRRIDRSKLRVGDLMFYVNNGDVYHVAMFAGRAGGRIRVLHAPRPGERVRIEPTWTSNWFAGTVRR